MKPFEFHPDAEVELYAQRDFYDSKEDGLGRGFVLLVFKSIVDICTTPHAYPSKNGVQHCYMDGFPFDIVFEEFDDKIVIWAVAHTKRFPGYWRERLK